MTRLLERLVAESSAETAERRRRLPQAELERGLRTAPPPRDFAAALRRPGLAVIAETKARTPLQGTLADDYRPASLVRAYEEGGAAAISVLAQKASFGGEPGHIAAARAACDLPVMRKDFVVDEYQVVEARVLGADAVLLIVAALSETRLFTLLECVRSLGMEALVETHDADELKRALSAGAKIVGVNHRDLDTFAVDTTLTERLRPLLPADVLCVSESGVRTREDALALRRAGADAILVGEALMRSADPAASIRDLAVP